MPSSLKRISFARLFVLCATIVIGGLSGMAHAEPLPPPPPPDAPILVEQLLRHSHNIIVEEDLTRGARFYIAPPVLRQMMVTNPYVATFVATQLTAIPPRPYRPVPIPKDPDYMVTWRMDDMAQQTALLYDGLWIYSQDIHKGPVIAANARIIYNEKLRHVVEAFSIALPATYWYIEALRETYLVTPVLDCPNRDMLIQRLTRIEAQLFEMRKLMDQLFVMEFFRPGFPPGWAFVEPTFMNYRINVAAPGPIGIAPFPYFQDGGRGGWYAPPPGVVPPVARPNMNQPVLNYDQGNWNNLYNGVLDNGYVGANPINGNPAAGVPGVGPNGIGGPNPNANAPIPQGGGMGPQAGGGMVGGQGAPAAGGQYGNAPGNGPLLQNQPNGGGQQYGPAYGGGGAMGQPGQVINNQQPLGNQPVQSGYPQQQQRPEFVQPGAAAGAGAPGGSSGNDTIPWGDFDASKIPQQQQR